MGQRFYIPRQCKKCGKDFIGRDKDNVIARYCSRKCHFHDVTTRERQIAAGKAAGALNILRLRGTGKVGYIKEYGRHQHRIVMEKKLGRRLTSQEIIHHIDHNKHNNHPDNLQLVTRSEHARIHFTKKIISTSTESNRPESI